MKISTQKKIFTDQEIPQKPSGCQVRYLLRTSYKNQTCAIFKELIKKLKREKRKKAQKQTKETFIGWNQKSESSKNVRNRYIVGEIKNK